MSIQIWDFFLNSSVRLNDVCIFGIFSLFKMVKFNINVKDWNTLVHAILWSIWLNRNSVIFKQNSRNLFSILYQILHLTSSWAEIIFLGRGSTASSISQAIQ